MDRLACVNVRNLDLQLLLNDHPEWRNLPAAVVSRNSPYGTILTINGAAGEAGVKPGLRYAAGLSFTPELQAGTVSRRKIEAGVEMIVRCLKGFSPQVEAIDTEPGLFLLDAGGLIPLFASYKQWSREVRRRLKEQGFEAVVAVGFSRFGCYAAAKSAGTDIRFDHPEQEREAALKAAIGVLNLKPRVSERLEMLGIRTVGAFLRLPAGGIGNRFGQETERTFYFASGALNLPLQPTEVEEEPECFQILPAAENSSLRILGYLERCLGPLLDDIRSRHRLVRRLEIALTLDQRELSLEPIMPAAPTSDSRLLLDLVSLRLERLQLPAEVVALRLSALTVSEGSSQTELFPSASPLALQETERTFARLRAVFGNDAVRRARLEDDHLPEHSYIWEKLERLELDAGGRVEREERGQKLEKGPSPAAGGRRLVRRILEEPVEITVRGSGPAATGCRPDKHTDNSPDNHRSPAGSTLQAALGFDRLWGPYSISSRWWSRERSREYYYVEDRFGSLLWLYFDTVRRQWLKSGSVE